MSRLRHEKGSRAGSGSGIHRLEASKPLPFKPEEERKCGGSIASGKPDKLGRKRGGKCHRADGGKINWIKSAIKPEHKGMEKRAAHKAGESTHEYMESHKHDSGKSGARARLGLRLSAMSKHKD